MEGAFRDRRTLRAIAATLLSLALLAERAAGRSFPVRFLVLAILCRAETIARAFVAEATEADRARLDLPCREWPCPDWLYPDELPAMRYGVADAEILALRLRMLAAVLGVLAEADDRFAAGSAGWALHFGGAPGREDAILLLVFPACRRRSCRSPPLWGRWPAGQRGA